MLHALDHRKAKLSSFRGQAVRLPIEDVITSTVFGPLEFMSQSDRSDALKGLLKFAGCTVRCHWPSLQIGFWPKMKPETPGLRSVYIEPDAILFDKSGIVLLIEVKWGAPLSQHELAAQWDALTEVSRSRAGHLLIVREKSSYQNSIDADRATIREAKKLPWSPVVLSWNEIARAFDAISATDNDGVRNWAVRVARILRREDQNVMEGWDHLGLRKVPHDAAGFRQAWFGQMLHVDNAWEWWIDG